MNVEQAQTKSQQAITDLENEIQEKKKQLAALRSTVERETLQDYELQTWDGKSVKLSQLFGDKKELLLISNMGKSCRYCTLWADGINGFTDHLSNRAAFALVSPDDIPTQKEFATPRGWRFPMFSDKDSPFRFDLGFRTDKGVMPGAMVFTKEKDGSIQLFSKTFFGPGDNYCSMWDFMDLMPEGHSTWQPQYNY